MANSIVKEEKITLDDGKEITVRPLNIKNLREFMAIVQKFGEIGGGEDDEDDDPDDELAGLDIMLEAVQVALRKTHPEIADDRDYLEENLNIHNVHKIMNLAGGVDMTADPNLPKTG